MPDAQPQASVGVLRCSKDYCRGTGQSQAKCSHCIIVDLGDLGIVLTRPGKTSLQVCETYIATNT